MRAWWPGPWRQAVTGAPGVRGQRGLRSPQGAGAGVPSPRGGRGRPGAPSTGPCPSWRLASSKRRSPDGACARMRVDRRVDVRARAGGGARMCVRRARGRRVCAGAGAGTCVRRWAGASGQWQRWRRVPFGPLRGFLPVGGRRWGPLALKRSGRPGGRPPCVPPAPGHLSAATQHRMAPSPAGGVREPPGSPLALRTGAVPSRKPHAGGRAAGSISTHHHVPLQEKERNAFSLLPVTELGLLTNPGQRGGTRDFVRSGQFNPIQCRRSSGNVQSQISFCSILSASPPQVAWGPEPPGGSRVDGEDAGHPATSMARDHCWPFWRWRLEEPCSGPGALPG